MKQALVTIDTKSLPFEDRLRFVKSFISSRIQQAPARKQHAIKARLWCVWLRREVLL